MSGKPTRQKLVELVSKRETDAGRRKAMQRGITATVAGLLAGTGATGSVSASGESELTVIDERVDRSVLSQEAVPLLEALAADGVIPRASSNVFSDAPRFSTQGSGGVFRYRVSETGAIKRSFVRYEDGTKLTINLPKEGEPYALFAPNGPESAQRVRYDQVMGEVETVQMEYQDSPTQADHSNCGTHCGGSVCSDAGNCLWEQRICSETCFCDSFGYCECHEDCECGC